MPFSQPHGFVVFLHVALARADFALRSTRKVQRSLCARWRRLVRMVRKTFHR